LERPGVVEVFCNIHEAMQATIVVVPSTYYAVIGDGGSFQMVGVPAGRYRLVGYAPEAAPAVEVSVPIEIRPRERTAVTLHLGQPELHREKRK
jgi:hypothetical protein